MASSFEKSVKGGTKIKVGMRSPFRVAASMATRKQRAVA
jgi:hypothetical protein